MQTIPAGVKPIWPPEDTGSKTVNFAAGVVAFTTIASIQLKNARRFFLAFIGNNVDSALIGHVTFQVVVDGQVLYPFTPTLGQWAPPEQPIQELSPYIELPQNAKVEIQASADSGSPGGNVTGRLRGYYAMIEPLGVGGAR